MGFREEFAEMVDARRRALGQFVWNTTTGQWRWDAGMYDVHGYAPGEVSVTSDLVLQHKQQDHRAHATEVFRTVSGQDSRFSNYHVIVDAKGRDRTVLAVGESRDRVVAPGVSHRLSRGFVVDVTLDEDAAVQSAVDAVRRNSAPIQQSLGVLMGSLGFDEETAVAMMRRVSSHHNVKLADLARAFMQACIDTAAAQPRDVAQLLVEQGARLARERIPAAPDRDVRSTTG